MNTKKQLFVIAVILGLALTVLGGRRVWKNLRGAGLAARGPGGDIPDRLPPSDDSRLPEAGNNTDFPLKLPKGFVISIFAQNLPGARALALDGFGNLWVSQTSEGKISKINIENGLPKPPVVVYKNLKKPHGLAFDPSGGAILYVAEETKRGVCILARMAGCMRQLVQRAMYAMKKTNAMRPFIL